MHGAGGKKIMCWAGLINGKIILHWFPLGTSVNQQVYLEMLATVVWPKIRAVSTRQQYWFQQNGATAHTTIQVRNWLASKFSNRIISRLTEKPWPARSPDLSPLDYWFWSVCLGELRRSPPSSLDELQEIVENFVESLQEEEVIKATRNILKRAKVCKEAGGGAFEFRLKKKQNMFAAEE